MSSTTSPSLLDVVRRAMRLKHYSLHTERCYCDWIKQFVKFHWMTERRAVGWARFLCPREANRWAILPTLHLFGLGRQTSRKNLLADGRGNRPIPWTHRIARR
ncbi:phage integrase N-terminal SAM-like domain-containing protein [Methylomonas sp. MV1]